MKQYYRKIYNFVVVALLTLNLLVGFVGVSVQVDNFERQEVLIKYLSTIAGEALEGAETEANFDIHLEARLYRDGKLIHYSEHAGTLTTVGKNYIEDQLGDSPNATAPAQWIALSNSAIAPAAAWQGLPAEINANNLTRAQGAYTSTGDGVWTIDYTFTASGNQAVQLAGLYWRAAPVTNGTLLCADQIAAANMIANDTLELTWTITVT